MKKLFFSILFFIVFTGSNIKAQAPANDGVRSINAHKNYYRSGFPYHPVAYFLDLSILCYQLYGGTLIWPFDPYYERVKKRSQFMDTVRKWAKAKGHEQNILPSSASDFRGPGELDSFANNERHDPIIYRYSSLNPWNNCIVNADGRWTIYETPKEITNQIAEVYMCYRKKGTEKEFIIEQIQPKSKRTPGINAANILICFEGGTGDKGEPNQPASQSLMGFVLLRKKSQSNFDIDIAFRGSRSGSGARAFIQAFPGKHPKGNPDWITDFGFDLRDSSEGAGNITTTGAVNRGMMYSMYSILPAVFTSLYFIDSITNHLAPDNIYVTGHSLGGALAQHFVSAVLMGSGYNADNTSDSSRNTLRNWPWKNIKLLTYSSPVAGNKDWAKKLTEEKLSSVFFSSRLNPYDRKALPVADTTIVSNLLNHTKPAAYRILVPTDPITSEKIGFRSKPVGKTVYVRPHTWTDIFRMIDLNAHEPMTVRCNIVQSLCGNDSIPFKAWEYKSMKKMNSNEKKYKKGSAEDIDNIVSGIKDYYKKNNILFDGTQLDEDVKLWKKLKGY